MEIICRKNELFKVVNKIKDNIKSNNFLFLSGDLGSGKTTLTKYLLEDYLKVNELVTSPTFTILNTYKSQENLIINHMDAYRLTENDELEMYFEQFYGAFNIIEWHQNIIKDLSDYKGYLINIKKIDDETRKFSIEEVS